MDYKYSEPEDVDYSSFTYDEFYPVWGTTVYRTING